MFLVSVPNLLLQYHDRGGKITYVILENQPICHILHFEKYQFELLNALCFANGI